MNKYKEAEEFYSALISLLLVKNQKFLIGGTYAFAQYTGISRPTKDLDIFVSPQVHQHVLQIFKSAGYGTELFDANWIAKVHKDKFTADIIFAEANGLNKVDETWIGRAHQGEVLGHMVKLIPIEEMIRSKAFIQYKERFDGADVIHLILCHGKTIDWNLLLEMFSSYYEILLGHLINFFFVYPSEKDQIPCWVIEKLIGKFEDNFCNNRIKEKITHGLLISSQYEVAVSKWGYKPVR